MTINNPSYLTYHHVYAETLLLDKNQVQPQVFRAITRDGNYAPAVGYASGFTYLEAFGTANIAFNAFGTDPQISIPDLSVAVDYPATGGAAVNAGDILKYANTNTFYFVPANATLDATGATLEDRIANDVAAGDVVPVPKNAIRDNLSAAVTPYAPLAFIQQRVIGMATDGIVIAEIATQDSATAAGVTAAAAINVDDPIYVGDNFGRVATIAVPGATDYVVGRALDATDVPVSGAGFGVPAGYIRVKLGSI